MSGSESRIVTVLGTAAMTSIAAGCLFTLFCLAGLFGLRRPLGSYDDNALRLFGNQLMLVAFLASASLWRARRAIAVIGLVACFLWIAYVLLPGL